MKEQIILAASKCIKVKDNSGSVSERTKNAQAIAKEWRTLCWNINPNRIQFEVSIHPDFNERIDVLDNEEMVAYEFKVSGKNAMNEFYKDIVKIIVWNNLKSENRVKKLVFITGEDGEKHLHKNFIDEYINILANDNLKIEIEYV